jgi:hypothetical protein
MERIARMAMEPVVVFGGTRRGGSCTSFELGRNIVEIWEVSSRRSESWRGDSEAEADRTWAGRSAVLEAVLRTTLESREWNRARDAEASGRGPGAEQNTT